MAKSENVIYDVELARDLKALLRVNEDIEYADISLKDKIWTIPENDLVRIGKSISSLKIVSVDIINDDFLRTIFG